MYSRGSTLALFHLLFHLLAGMGWGVDVIERISTDGGGPPKMEVREAGPQDLSAISELSKLSDKPISPEMIRATLDPDSQRRALVASVEGKVVGYLFFEDKYSISITHLFASPKLRTADPLSLLITNIQERASLGRPPKQVGARIGDDLHLGALLREHGFEARENPGVYQYDPKGYQTQLTIEAARRANLQQMVENEEAIYGDSYWGAEKIAAVLRKPDTIGQVAVVDGKIVGHMFYGLQNDRFQLLRFVVAPEYRNSDVERQMIDELVRSLYRRGRLLVEFRVPVGLSRTLKVFTRELFKTKNTVASPLGPVVVLQRSITQARVEPSYLKERNHFDRLGVNILSSDEAIRAAFKRLVDGAIVSEEALKLLKESRRVLTRQSERRAYLLNNRDTLTHLGGSRDRFRPESFSLYERLGVNENSGQREIERAFDHALLVYSDPSDAKNLEAVRSAYKLLQPEPRKLYDAIIQTTEGASRLAALKRFAKGDAVYDKAAVSASELRKNSAAEEVKGSLYERLGVVRNADRNEIFNAYVDIMNSSASGKVKKRATTAFKVLSSKPWREEYADIMADSSSEGLKKRLARLLAKAYAKPSAAIPIKTPPEFATRESQSVSPSYYQRLGVAENSTAEQIEEAYRSLLGKPGRSLAERVAERTAFEVLYSPRFRNWYDHIQRVRDPNHRALAVQRLDKVVRVQAEAERSGKLEKQPSTVFGTPDPQAENLYYRLGLSLNASERALRDRFEEIEATAKRAEISASDFKRYLSAYAVLIEPSDRGVYNRSLNAIPSLRAGFQPELERKAYQSYRRKEIEADLSNAVDFKEAIVAMYGDHGFGGSPRFAEKCFSNLLGKINSLRGDPGELAEMAQRLGNLSEQLPGDGAFASVAQQFGAAKALLVDLQTQFGRHVFLNLPKSPGGIVQGMELVASAPPQVITGYLTAYRAAETAPGNDCPWSGLQRP